MWWALFFCCLPGLRGIHQMVVSYLIQMHMSFAISWWSPLVYLLAKIASFAPGSTAWPGMHMCLSALALLHTQCMFVQRLLWLLQQAMAPGSTPQVCSQDWDRCDSVFQLFISFLHFVIFKFPSSGVQGSLSSSAPCCRAVGRHSLHGRQPATRAGRQEEPASRAASTHTHGHSNCSSQLITLQPACLSCFLFH